METAHMDSAPVSQLRKYSSLPSRAHTGQPPQALPSAGIHHRSFGNVVRAGADAAAAEAILEGWPRQAPTSQ